jgi:hypothetical protein
MWCQRHREPSRDLQPTDVAPSSRSRVNSNNNSAFEPERECRCTMLNLDPTRRVRVIVGV